MSGRRIAMSVTCVVVFALGVTFVFVSTDAGNRLAAIVSSLAVVAAVGVAVWAALPERKRDPAITVRRTGKATAGPNGVANSGVIGSTDGPIEVQDTGDADASDSGSANTGIRLD